MKKSVFLLSIILILILMNCNCFATEDIMAVEEELNEATIVVDENEEAKEEVQEDKEEYKLDTSKVNGASEEILETMSRKDERIRVLTQKYNDKTLGRVAYGLEVVRFYSTPLLFIFLVIGAFNFFIVGNKKLDKKEQGFGWISACLVGWVVFQCIPLIFALLTIGLTK